MKTPLLLISIPYAISFLAGMFEWYMEDGMYILLALAMLVGIVWGWIIELKK